ncbi:MAG: hypothetical protein PHY54_03810 [Methylococcales bacterium]|nr:hypothetical protein [Methylococcales bacterium]
MTRTALSKDIAIQDNACLAGTLLKNGYAVFNQHEKGNHHANG